MAEQVTCFACEREPEHQCARCGRPYCSEHGEELCDACLQPASGVPSFTLYRGSLLALLIGTALAVWLLVQPGDNEGETAFRPVEVPTPVAGGTNPTPSPDITPSDGTVVPGPTATGSPTVQATPGTGGGSGGTVTYTVEPGDSLLAVCEALGPVSLSAAECAEQVVLLNGLSSPDAISVGEELLIPQ